MKTLRRFLMVLSVLVVLGVFASIGGILFDPSRITFWSTSLIGTFLAALLLAPALVMLYDETLVGPSGVSSRSAQGRSSDAASGEPPFAQETGAGPPVSETEEDKR